MIHLEVDTREEEGWTESVELQGVPQKYKLYKDEKNWTAAEAHCQQEGGHLAATPTLKDFYDIMLFIQPDVKQIDSKRLWVGGNDMEKEGDWRWTTGSNWGFTFWQPEFSNRGGGYDCVSMMLEFGGRMGDLLCNKNYSFVCQFDPIILRGNRNMTFEYTKDQLPESLVRLWYRYQVPSNQELLESWKGRLMTGFRASWKIENKYGPLKMTQTELGRAVQTHGFKDGPYLKEYYDSDQSYTSKLLFPNNFADKLGSGSLVIELEVDTRDKDWSVWEGWVDEDDGWQEYIIYGEATKYKLFWIEKTWQDAEAHCQSLNGTLATIHSEKEQEEVLATFDGLVTSTKWGWLGGRDDGGQGVWQWVDGTPWGYTAWRFEGGSLGSPFNCVMMMNGNWWDMPCVGAAPFICQFHTDDWTKTAVYNGRVARGKTKRSVRYTQADLNFTSFQVKYIYYKAEKQEEVTKDDFFIPPPQSWGDYLIEKSSKRMTGFKLNWFIEASNGTQLTESLPSVPDDWKPEVTYPQFHEQYLTLMVGVASLARANNLTTESIINQTIHQKANIVNSNSFKFNTMCDRDQVKPIFYPKVFNKINFPLDYSIQVKTLTEADIMTGFMMFSTMIYCSESVALYQFLHNLLSTQSPRTIIKATFNTISSINIAYDRNREMLNEFYFKLEKVFDFELGKILLATHSPSQLQGMLDKKKPYLNSFSNDLKHCLESESCQVVGDLVQTLGESCLNEHITPLSFQV